MYEMVFEKLEELIGEWSTHFEDLVEMVGEVDGVDYADGFGEYIDAVLENDDEVRVRVSFAGSTYWIERVEA